jgi:hypothetical protein
MVPEEQLFQDASQFLASYTKQFLVMVLGCITLVSEAIHLHEGSQLRYLVQSTVTLRLLP